MCSIDFMLPDTAFDLLTIPKTNFKHWFLRVLQLDDVLTLILGKQWLCKTLIA